MPGLKAGAQRRWLVTGVAGFIGSNLLEALLMQGQEVIGVDNFLTGKPENLNEVEENVGADAWSRFRFIKGDIRDLAVCRDCCDGADVILHQAALGSVPRSIESPLDTHANNVNATLNLLVAAKDAGIRRMVFASSSSVYGDHPGLPKVEDQIGNCLSPYAVTKRVVELYTGVFARCYGIKTIGLRYFNVFGARQDPDGVYAAVIPKWIQAMLAGESVSIYGDGETSRDFCYIDNVIQANLLAATTERTEALNEVYNIAVGGRATLNELFDLMRSRLSALDPELKIAAPAYKEFRPGDIRHSNANIDKAVQMLGYSPTHNLEQGMGAALDWYLKSLAKSFAGRA